MAFLDNSGDIILDAVLTDVGRKRMAKGNFRITKFSIGDDEIDYGLYNKNHPSGSAYNDLEILQTPILEAFTQMNANINYGLVSYPRQDLLYLPSMDQNEKTFSPRIVQASSVSSAGGGMIFLSDDSKTNANGAVTSKVMITDGARAENILIGGTTDGRVILVETGIASDTLASTAANQSTFITSVGLMDSSFMVQFDKRFIQTALGPQGGATMGNSAQGGATLSVTIGKTKTTRRSRALTNYNETVVQGAVNRIYAQRSTRRDDISSDYSAFTGPRGAFTAFNLSIRPDITQSDYSKYGTQASALFGTSNTYDYIDTTVYIRGAASNASIQLPIRIIKLSQT